MSGKLLIVEDEFLISQDIRQTTSDLGYAVMGIAKSAEEALAALKKELPDLVLLDINIMGETNGIELAKIIEQQYRLPYIYITSYSDTKTLKEMNRTNPLGYILKPFDKRDVRVALDIGFAKMGDTPIQKKKAGTVKRQDSENKTTIIGESPAINEALKKVAQVAPTDATVLIQGETGTGKELFMEAIHKSSGRADKKIIKVNCAALPKDLIESVLFGHEKGSFTGATEKRKGKFELADGGSIFLDEIGELPLGSQAKLLRCLQEKEIETIGGNYSKKIDVRIIAATNKNLAKEVQEGSFRADLFFRLNIFPIKIPPLRERKGDIHRLTRYFLETSARKLNKSVKKIAPKTLTSFEKYAWPGNVRELQHYVERGVILAENNELSIKLDSVDQNILFNTEEYKLKSLEDIEREQIIHTLAYCSGRIRGSGGAAEILKLHPNTLDFKIKKLGINKNIIYN
ncbi:MAG: sigma-54 dependent transcriptional regulator [Bacteroidota bacterium]